ncbi:MULTISPECIES: STAS domain-containing protein [unclassified Nonomuraea]|uniref:STAS domain-containing protein n=1 Tax=unclassified Nonomuraea TaxID=2593643 RepID=UPI0033E858A4
MHLASSYLPGITVVTVAGEVDATASGHLEAYLDQVRRSLDEHLIFDVSRLAFLDSSGLSVLLAAATLARAHGVDVHLAGLRPTVARLLEITGTVELVTIHDHVTRAVAAVEALRDARAGALEAAGPTEAV